MAVAYRCFADTAEEVAGFTEVELCKQRHKRGRKLRTKLVPLIPAGVALRWLTRRARELHKCLEEQRWEQLEAVLSGSQDPPAWMPTAQTYAHQALHALASIGKLCATKAGQEISGGETTRTRECQAPQVAGGSARMDAKGN